MPHPSPAEPETADHLVALTRQLLQTMVVLAHEIDQQAGLGPTDLRALQALDRLAAGPVPVGTLAAALALSSGATTELVDRLESAGLARRERDDRDRRRVLVALQPAARQIGATHLEPWDRRVKAAVQALDPAEAAAVGRYLEALLAP